MSRSSYSGQYGLVLRNVSLKISNKFIRHKSCPNLFSTGIFILKQQVVFQ